MHCDLEVDKTSPPMANGHGLCLFKFGIQISGPAEGRIGSAACFWARPNSSVGAGAAAAGDGLHSGIRLKMGRRVDLTCLDGKSARRGIIIRHGFLPCHCHIPVRHCLT